MNGAALIYILAIALRSFQDPLYINITYLNENLLIRNVKYTLAKKIKNVKIQYNLEFDIPKRHTHARVSV